MGALVHIAYLLGGVVGIALIAVYAFFHFKFLYWKRRGIAQIEPSFPMGNLGGVNVSKSFAELVKELYDQSKFRPYTGIFFAFRPTLLVNNLDLIKQMFVKDFSSFQDRGIYTNEERDPLAAHLFSIGGPIWKKLRVKLSPTFTSGKMKMMFQIIADTAEQFKKTLEPLAKNNEVVEMKDLAARFTTDIISSCAFGIQANSLENDQSDFREMGRKVFEFTSSEALINFLNFVSPKLAELFKVKTIKPDVEKFFMDAVRNTIEYRKKNKVERKDFMQLLIQLQDKGYIEDPDNPQEEPESAEKLTFNQLAAQAFVFFLGGFETSSTTTQWALYEMALHPDLQEKTRKDIDEVLAKHGGKITYDSVMDMKYLDRVVAETLRKYPPVPFLQRECNKRYQIPDSNDFIEKGTMMFMPIYGIHMDPQYFPNPEKFDPDRFTEEEKQKRHNFAYLPFGEGPRNCIGMRFGLLQTKVGLATVLSNYEVHVCDKTPIPLKLDPVQFVFTPAGGHMHLRISKRNN